VRPWLWLEFLWEFGYIWSFGKHHGYIWSLPLKFHNTRCSHCRRFDSVWIGFQNYDTVL